MIKCLVRGSLVAALIFIASQADARPTPLHVVPGSSGAIVNGRVTTRVYQRQYVLAARAGQTMILTFTGNGPMRGSVSCRGGGDGPFYGDGNTFRVPSTGFCVINVGANPMAENWTGRFTMAVLLSRPTAAIRQRRGMSAQHARPRRQAAKR